MKNLHSIALSFLITMASLYADSNTPAKDTIWSRSWATSGDASDSTYYFIGREGSVIRVRILSMAAYEHEASGTDYFLEGGSIRVDKIRGTKDKEAQQIKGKDDGITVASTYTLTSTTAEDVLISSLGNEHLTVKQRLDLDELISILKDCVPAKHNDAEQQGGADQPAKPPELKSEGNEKPQPQSKVAPQ